MAKLAEEVLLRVGPALKTSYFDEDVHTEWKKIAVALENGEGLEQAINSESLPDQLGELIALHASECVREDEVVAIEAMVHDNEPGVFARMAAHLARVDSRASIITTNYDRLIEVDLALAGVGVDSMFSGHPIGRLDEESAYQEHEYLEWSTGPRRRQKRAVRPHVQLSKPHGSLDWFTSENGGIIRTDLPFQGSRKVVAPGGSKYRLGYESPFDVHRERANRAIDRATSLLVVGYGFNDDHLQTHLKPIFASVPSVMVSYSLTDNARAFLSTNPDAVGIERGQTDDCSVVVCQKREIIVDRGIWQLDVLLREALQI
jgi:hypothetical protein